MSKSKNFLRSAFDAMIDARMREAERMVARYKTTANDLTFNDTPKR